MKDTPEQTDAGHVHCDCHRGSQWRIIVSILLAGWLIGMSIILAGWLVSQKLANVGGTTANTNTPPLVDNNPIDISISTTKPVLGNADAPVTIVEFADYQCPFCGQWEKQIYPNLKKDFIDTGKAKLVYWDFAFLGEESLRAAEAANCALDQRKFWEYHDMLFAKQDGENQGAFADKQLISFAQSINLDMTKFNSCFSARLYKPLIEESIEQATSYGVNSTPTVFINGKRIQALQPYSLYKSVIEGELLNE